MACLLDTLGLPRGTQPTEMAPLLTMPGMGRGLRSLSAETELCQGPKRHPVNFGPASPHYSSLERSGGDSSLHQEEEGRDSGATIQNCTSHPTPSPARPMRLCCHHPHGPARKAHTPHFCLHGPPPSPPHTVAVTPPPAASSQLRAALAAGAEEGPKMCSRASVGLETSRRLM